MSSDEDWSDSDSELEVEQKGEIATSVLLGIPDGPLTSAYDDADPTVSRAGGLPPFLPLKQYPSPEAALLSSVRSKAPRTTVSYMYGAVRRLDAKGRKAGSIRAYRSLCHNAKYARKLEKQKARQAASTAESSKTLDSSKHRTNPFVSVSATSPDQGTPTNGLGDILFGSMNIGESNGKDESGSGWSDDESGEEDAEDDEDSRDEEEPTEPGHSTGEGGERGQPDPAWASQPSYSPFYISTVEEYITPKPLPVSKKVINEAQSSDSAGGAPWGKEAYEVMHKVDDIFEKFVSRVQEEPEQVLRYDLSGTPLPFSSRDSTYKRLFPAQPIPPGTAIAVNAPPPAPKHAYDPSAVDPCPRCGGPRVFECQLMPNLINILKRKPTLGPAKQQSAQERQQELESLLRGSSDGMEWGTVMIFSCLSDCCLDPDRAPATEAWAEELVFVQWDD